MAKQSVVPVVPTVTEDLVAGVKLVAHKKTAIARGWDAITPEVIANARAADEARTAALTAHYLAKFG